MNEYVSSDPPAIGLTTEERQWAIFAHLASLVAMWAGYLGFLGPLIIWLIKKNQMPYVDEQGKEALNFQLNMFALGVGLGIVGVPLVFLTLGLGAILLAPLALGLVAYSIVMPIMAAISANAGEPYRYPYVVRVIK